MAPIVSKVQELIENYKSHILTKISETLFPVITNERTNLYLKEIAEACGIKKTNFPYGQTYFCHNSDFK